MNNRMNISVESGLTLIELLTVIVLLGITLALGVPSFIQAMQNARTTSQANEMIGMLHLARAEAVKRGAPMSVRSTEANWGGDIQVVTEGGTVVRQASIVENATASASNEDGSVSSLTFRGSGFFDGKEATLTLVADNCSGNNRRTITVGRAGSITSAKLACP